MRLCLVTETYPPEVNGVARTLGTLCRIMATRGHEVSVVRPRPGDPPVPVAGVIETAVPGAPMPGYPRLRFGWPAPGLLARSWRARRPDVVHVATEGPLGWSAVRLARRQGIPVASSFHTNFHEYGPHYGLRLLAGVSLRYFRWFHGRTAITLVPSPTARRRLLELGFSRVDVLPRGVDTRQFDPARRSNELRSSWGASPGDPVLLYVGRIAPEKNVELAVAAFYAVRAKAPRARLVLVGDGPAAPRLRQEHGDLVWAGERRGADLGAHYASADLFLFPSLTETFGNVLIEALAAGLATVAFDYAAAAMHVRTGDNGVAVLKGDRDAFVAAATGLAVAPGLRRRLGSAARATALGLSWEQVADRWERILLRLAGAAESPGVAARDRSCQRCE